MTFLLIFFSCLDLHLAYENFPGEIYVACPKFSSLCVFFSGVLISSMIKGVPVVALISQRAFDVFFTASKFSVPRNASSNNRGISPFSVEKSGSIS